MKDTLFSFVGTNFKSPSQYLYKILVDNKKALLFLCATAAITFLPILLSNAYYKDDLARGYGMGFGWHADGRYLTSLLAILYSVPNTDLIGLENIVRPFGIGTLDPFPFSWMLSVFFIGLSGTLIYAVFRRHGRYTATIFGVIIIVNPFTVANLLYRFDSIPMLLSYLLVISAFCLSNRKKYSLFAIFLLFLSLNLYQSFSYMYMGLLAIKVLLLHMQKRELDLTLLLKLVVFRMALLFIAIFTYFVFIKLLGTNSRGDIMAINVGMINRVIMNYVDSFGPIVEYLNWAFFFMIIPFSVAAYSLLKVFFSRKRGWLVVPIVLLIIFVSGMGPMAILEHYVYHPRSTSSFPAILMLCAALLIYLRKRLVFLIVPLLLVNMLFVARIGNISELQKSFENSVFTMAVRDLSSIQNIEKIHSIGAVPYAANVRVLLKNTPFNGLINRNAWQSTAILRMFNLENIEFLWVEEYGRMVADFRTTFNVRLAIDSPPYYKIYTKGKTAWIIWSP